MLYSKAQITYYSRYLLTSYFWIPVPYDEKGMDFKSVELPVPYHKMITLGFFF